MSQTQDTFSIVSRFFRRNDLKGVVGPAVGKSRLIVRFVNNEYTEQEDPTVGML